jgi:hypothetical protein
MTGALLLALLLGAEPSPRTATLQPGETLVALARRTLGDTEAASELAAINGLAPGAVLAPGTTVQLPGPDRALAQSALAAAKSALKQAGTGAPKSADAQLKLNEAVRHFQAARYGEAAHAADAAWQLVSHKAQLPTQFAVQVADTGRTEVTAKGGQPVRVEAAGVTQPVYAGHTVSVEKGEAPARPAEVLAAPALAAPADQAQILVKAGEQAQVTLSWRAVTGAKSYEVELTAPEGTPVVLKVHKPEAKLPPLSHGKYAWAVRSVGDAAKSDLSQKRWFELQADQIKLEVRGAGWK